MRWIILIIVMFWFYKQIELTTAATPVSKAQTKQCKGFITNYKGQALHIPASKLPIVFVPHRNIPQEWYDDIEMAMEYINIVAKRDIFLLDRDNPIYYEEITNSIPENIMYLSLKPYSENEQATSRLFWINGEIKKVHMKFNIHAFDFATSDSGIHKNKIHLKTLMIHELLHSLGMEHVRNNSHSVMYPYINLGEERTLLTTAEKAAILCMYEKPY